MAGGTAGIPTTLVELSISCRNLRDYDILSKSDPLCIVYHQPFGTAQWAELKRTECIKNNLNPDFATKIPINYRFEEQQRLRLSLYDIDSSSADISDNDFLGEYECTLAELVSYGSTEKTLKIKTEPAGTIIIKTEELGSCKEELTLQFVGGKIENSNWFCSISPFLEFSKANEDGSFTLVHRTEKAHKTEHPIWKDFTVPLRSFCSADIERNIKVECKDYRSGGDHKSIGAFYTTVRKLKEGPGQGNTYWVVNEEKKKRKGSSYKNSGEVVLNKAFSQHIYSFVDYIKGGMEINAFIAIDFTASNGNPTSQNSLHAINPIPPPNQYVQAIQSVGHIIEDYDTDKYFPVLGFGARMPPDYTTVSHEFFVNGDASNPFCHRVQGVIDAYYGSLQRVQLYGPTNFAPIINHVARFATTNKGGDKYFILLILTDGIITDMQQTTEAIVNASSLPLSIIIVGVGQAEFDAMEALDGDKVRLNSHGRYAVRDIVQFVAFRDFIKPGMDPRTSSLLLAREVLAEVPAQVLSFTKSAGITPQPPRISGGQLPTMAVE